MAAGISWRRIHAFRERRYARALQRHRDALPQLSGIPNGIVSDLIRTGISQAPLDDLDIPEASEVVSLAEQLVTRDIGYFNSQASDGIQFLMLRSADIAANPQLYLFGLHPLLLDIAEAYIGLPVAYDGVSIQYTVADGRAVATRDWHRDREDRKMLKIAIYLNDVDASGGPFQLHPGISSSAREYRFLYSLTPEERMKLEAGAMGEPVECDGPRGTAVFADTARYFHRGKPALGQDRAAMFFSYFAQNPQRPFFCDRSGLRRDEIGRMVQGLSPRQRSAALWHEALPLRWRLIPTASIL
jgi:hypothetical protein